MARLKRKRGGRAHKAVAFVQPIDLEYPGARSRRWAGQPLGGVDRQANETGGAVRR